MDALQLGDPQRIGKYKVLGRLGSGGMGRVFLGQSPGGRLVAVKLIHPDLAEAADFRARFEREIEAARRVSGIYTAAVVDADGSAPEPWLVTEYVEGPSLDDVVIANGSLPVESVLALARGLAEGLGAIHAAGIVHRDLKPSNVLIARDGPRIIDFGISRALDTPRMTSPRWIGSPGFMAPEQAAGQEVSAASDIFSLGAVLAFAASGEGPFGKGERSDLIDRVLNAQPEVSNLPPPVRSLVERCLAKDPLQRPGTDQIIADVGPPPARRAWLPAQVTRSLRAYARPRVDVPAAEPDSRTGAPTEITGTSDSGAQNPGDAARPAPELADQREESQLAATALSWRRIRQRAAWTLGVLGTASAVTGIVLASVGIGAPGFRAAQGIPPGPTTSTSPGTPTSHPSRQRPSSHAPSRAGSATPTTRPASTISKTPSAAPAPSPSSKPPPHRLRIKSPAAGGRLNNDQAIEPTPVSCGFKPTANKPFTFAPGLIGSAEPATSMPLPSGASDYFYVGSDAGGDPLTAISWHEDLSVTAAYSGNESVSIGQSASASGSFASGSTTNVAIAGLAVRGYRIDGTPVSMYTSSGTSVAVTATTKPGDLLLVVVGGEGAGLLQHSGTTLSTLLNVTYSECGSNVIASAGMFASTPLPGTHSVTFSATTYPTDAGTAIGVIAYVLAPHSQS